MKDEHIVIIFEIALLLSSLVLGYCLGRIVSISESETIEKFFIDREIRIQENFKDFYRCRPIGNITKIQIVEGAINDTR